MISKLLDECYWNDFSQVMLLECAKLGINEYVFYYTDEKIDFRKIAQEFFNDFLIVKEGYFRWCEMQHYRYRVAAIKVTFSIEEIIAIVESDLIQVEGILLKDVMYYSNSLKNVEYLIKEKDLSVIYKEIQEFVAQEKATWEQWKDSLFYDR